MTWPYGILDNFCAKVNLRRSSQMPRSEMFDAPRPEVALWIGDYAQVLLWPVSAATDLAISEAAEKGQSWLDNALATAEGARGVVDGYLVLALPEAPSREIEPLVRK